MVHCAVFQCRQLEEKQKQTSNLKVPSLWEDRLGGFNNRSLQKSFSATWPYSGTGCRANVLDTLAFFLQIECTF